MRPRGHTTYSYYRSLHGEYFCYYKYMKKPRIPQGPIVRNYKYQREYNKYRKIKPAEKCQFCSIVEDEIHEQKLITEYPLFWVIVAKFPYYIWDGARTGEHLLLVPKRHIDSIAHFTSEEKVEFADALAEWEGKGYSLYARSAQNEHKSVPHQHTHLIEVGKSIKGQFYLNKPFINIAR